MANEASERRPARLTFEVVAPVLRGSRLAARCVAAWTWLEMAVIQSRFAAVTGHLLAKMRIVPIATFVFYGAWIVAAAAVTNLVMLTVVERYHFPRPTALILPALVAIAALVVGATSTDFARAVEDKRDR